MKPQNIEEGAKKEEEKEEKIEEGSSYTKEQASYWNAFMQDLFVGTLKRMIVSPFVFGLTFFAIAFLIYNLSIKPQQLLWLLKLFEILMIFILYLVMGILCGLIYGANSTLLKKTEELENGVHFIVNPFMAAILERMPGGQKRMTIEEFNNVLHEQIHRFKRTSPFQFRFLSLLSMFSRFFLRMTLRILRYILLHDFLEKLQEQGETHVSAKTVETYYREKIVSDVTGVFTGKLELIQTGVYGVLIVFLVIPVGLIMLL